MLNSGKFVLFSLCTPLGTWSFSQFKIFRPQKIHSTQSSFNSAFGVGKKLQAASSSFWANLFLPIDKRLKTCTIFKEIYKFLIKFPLYWELVILVMGAHWTHVTEKMKHALIMSPIYSFNSFIKWHKIFRNIKNGAPIEQVS